MLNFVVRRSSLIAMFFVLIVVPSLAHAGIFSWLTGSSRRSAEESKEQWYAARAGDPTGSRQQYINGKLWPPQPRPTGDPQLFSHMYHAAHYWPHPYQCEDRSYVRDVSRREVNNGWIKATTLYDYHFNNDTHALNRAGRIQLRWILQNTPTNHRFAFVQTGVNAKASQFRVTSVQTEAVEMVGQNNVPPIMLRVTTPLGRPAIEVDQIRRGELDSLPVPRITDAVGGGGRMNALGGGQ